MSGNNPPKIPWIFSWMRSQVFLINNVLFKFLKVFLKLVMFEKISVYKFYRSYTEENNGIWLHCALLTEITEGEFSVFLMNFQTELKCFTLCSVQTNLYVKTMTELNNSDIFPSIHGNCLNNVFNFAEDFPISLFRHHILSC